MPLRSRKGQAIRDTSLFFLRILFYNKTTEKRKEREKKTSYCKKAEEKPIYHCGDDFLSFPFPFFSSSSSFLYTNDIQSFFSFSD